MDNNLDPMTSFGTLWRLPEATYRVFRNLVSFLEDKWTLLRIFELD